MPDLPTMTGVLTRRAAERAQDVAVVDGPSRVTWAELDVAVSAVAAGWLGTGLQPGDRVAVQLGTGLDFVTTYYGVLRAGGVVVPVNPGYTLPELTHVLTDSGARWLVTSSPVASGADLPATVLAPTQLGIDASSAPVPHGDWPDRTGEQLAVLLYTSGTTGTPKGAMLSARALLANVEQVLAVRPALVGPQDVCLVPVPLFHIFGLNGGLGVALHAGARVVLSDRFDPAAVLELAARERATSLVGVPTMFAALLAADRDRFEAGFASVHLALSGSAPLPAGLAAAYREAGVVLHEGYGLSETAPVLTVTAQGAARDHPTPRSIGRPLPGVEIRLRERGGAEAAAEPGGDEHDPGELHVRGANLFSGYWPDGADGPDADGWFPTGDIALTDDDGALFLVGRTSDLVLVNGFNVYPAEVEAALGAQPGVAEAGVLGRPDPRTGEAVVAFVVPVAGAQLDPADLLAGARSSLARFKLPSEIRVVDSLPHTTTGKVMKWKLDSAARTGSG